MSNGDSPDSDLLILHHYDFSPFSEKVRLIFGLKQLSWRSVRVPSVMPKPDLVALTGGYRHVPVLQIGADVFCDTRTIARELDRRFAHPSLDRGLNSGLARAIEAWAERDLFWPIARYVSGVNAETVDPQLHVDRAALRGKPTPSTDRLKSVARRNLAQIRAELATVESMLSGPNPALSPGAPGRADIAVYHGLWFLSAFAIDCSHELGPFPRTRAWMTDVAKLGHGNHRELSASDALHIARESAPRPLPPAVDDDSLPAVGCSVGVRPDDYHTPEVKGTLMHLDWDDVAVLRDDPRLGEVMLHFPRVGYTVKHAAEPGSQRA